LGSLKNKNLDYIILYIFLLYCWCHWNR